jgi:hypothetical protein
MGIEKLINRSLTLKFGFTSFFLVFLFNNLLLQIFLDLAYMKQQGLGKIFLFSYFQQLCVYCPLIYFISFLHLTIIVACIHKCEATWSRKDLIEIEKLYFLNLEP